MSDDITKKLEAQDEQLSTIALGVVENRERLERLESNVATKKDISELAGTLDTLVHLAKKKDQELTFMGNRVERIENDVKQVKPLVGLA